MGKKRILIVDDSAVVREVLGCLFSHEPDCEVAVAADPLIARQKIARARHR